MAKQVLLAMYVNLAVTDVSSYTSKAEIAFASEGQDVTTYASNGWHEFLGGLKQATVNFEFFNDFGAAALDQLMFPLLGTLVAVELRPTQSARSSSNPAYTGNLLVDSWNAITGGVGAPATVSVSYKSSGAMLRAIV